MNLLKIQFLLALGLFCFHLESPAQTPARDWNIGVSEGFGGVHYFFFPSLDLLYGRHTIRFSPMLPAQSVEYQFAFAQLKANEEGNLNLVTALAYTRSNDKWQIPLLGDRIWFIPSDRLNLLTGIRYDFGKRMTLGIMLGAGLQKIRETGNFAVTTPSTLRLKPGFEANIGLRLFKYSNHLP